MQAFEILEPGNYYHIYNHGVGKRDLFYDSENFKYFLNLYSKYIFPIARTYAWALMKNHFHFLVQIKECESKDLGTPDRVPNPVRDTKIGTASSQFSKLFNAYAQSINKRYNFRGSLFERPFKRKLIDDENYLKQVILYIHNNPVHHEVCKVSYKYRWSSYRTFLSKKATRIEREEVLEWFGGLKNFKYCHNRQIEIERIENWLEI